jgi:hypothetical protein
LEHGQYNTIADWSKAQGIANGCKDETIIDSEPIANEIARRRDLRFKGRYEKLHPGQSLQGSRRFPHESGLTLAAQCESRGLNRSDHKQLTGHSEPATFPKQLHHMAFCEPTELKVDGVRTEDPGILREKNAIITRSQFLVVRTK